MHFFRNTSIMTIGRFLLLEAKSKARHHTLGIWTEWYRFNFTFTETEVGKKFEPIVQPKRLDDKEKYRGERFGLSD